MHRATLAAVILALSPAVAAHATEEMTIDDFEYGTSEAAQAAWVAAEDSLPAGIMEHDGGTALQLNADFTTDSRRAVYDREVDLDLSRWGRFTLDVYIDEPGLFGSFTLYFQTEGGWYAASVSLGKQGWKTVLIPRSAFRVEDEPSGWQHITGIRLAAWRGAEKKGFCAVDNFKAYRENKVVVQGTNTKGSEARTVQGCAERVSNMLQEAGVNIGTIGDEDVEAGALEGRELAIFAYNPDMTEAEVEKVRQFVADGGKVFLFYTLPTGMADILGIKQTGWTQREYDGQFSQIRLEADDIPGLPAEVSQDSWNVTIVEPVEDRARVIGWWHDSEGKDTTYPAFTMSDAGVFMSHILLGDDYANKKALMVALVGHYLPNIWPEVADKALKGPGRIGHIEGVEAARAWIEAQAAELPNAADIGEQLAASTDAHQQALDLVNAQQYPQAVTAAGEAYQRLGEAYLLAHLPRAGEFRGCWNHSGTGAYDTWEASMKNLHDCGMNAIMPNMSWGGVALYESEYLPHAPVVAEKGDQIALCVAAAKKYGIEVHPWKVNWNLGRVPEDFKQQLLDEGRLQVDYNGNTVNWLCPSDPRNQELELNTMVEVARNYDVDGVHFDYIRYPGSNTCFCEGCRKRFQKDTGIEVENWPQDTRDKDDVKEAWIQWRCDQISRLVRRTSEEVRKIKPDCKISAAVFGSYPGCRVGVGQDWVHWIEQGWLDFVCPMDYITSDASFAGIVATQMSQVAGRVPLYPGIGAWRLGTPDRVAGQIEIARNLGGDGFILFNYTRSLADDMLPELARGILAQRTEVLPHNAPSFQFALGQPGSDATYGLHVAEGATVEATVSRGEDIPGRDFGAVSGTVVLQDADGREVRQLGQAPTQAQAVKVTFSARRGLFRLAVIGEASAGGQPRSFVCRSLPIIFGGIREDIAVLR